jgi:hypothetical protein
MRRRDLTGRRVVVCAEVRAGDAAASRRHERRQRYRALRIEDRLRGFDHQLHDEGTARESMLLLEPIERGGERGNLDRRRDLRQRDGEVCGSTPRGLFHQGVHDDGEGAETPRGELVGERLDADANPGGQGPFCGTCRELSARRGSVTVLFIVAARAIPVFEVDAEVLDRLAREFLAHTRVDAFGQLAIVEAERSRQFVGIPRVFLERLTRDSAQFLRRVGREEMRSAVYGVDRLPPIGVARIAEGHVAIALAEVG